MGRFIKTIILFSILLTAILFLMQGLVSWRIKGKTVRGYDNFQVTSNLNADLVLLGSSRCWAHFDPSFFHQTFGVKSVNLGVDGHTELATTVLRLKNYLARNQAPKYAILSFDPFTVVGSIDDNQNFVHKDSFSRYAFFPNEIDAPMVNHFKFDWQEKYIPLYSIFKNRLFVDCLTLSNSGDYLLYGFEKHTEKWDTIKKPITSVLKKSFFKDRDIASITQALKELNQFCQQKNIQLMCIQTPVYKIIADQEAFSRPAQICKSLNMPYVDANQPSIQENINFFYNSNHLNGQGVQAMNDYLKKDGVLWAFLKQKTVND